MSTLIERMAKKLTAIDNMKTAFPKDFRCRVGYKTAIEQLEADCRQLLREHYGYIWDSKNGLQTARDYAEAGRSPWLPRIGVSAPFFPNKLTVEELK